MNNLKALRKSRKLTQTEVAKYIGIGQSGYSDWERGETPMDSMTVQKLAAYFGVTTDYLLGTDSIKSTGVIRIPVLGSVPAGIPIEAIQDIEGWEEIPEAMCRGGKEYFGLKVKGDSMWPQFMEGDVVIVRKTPCCESGDICVVYINGYDATLKQVKLGEDGSLSIIPKNPSYPPRTFTPQEVKELPVSICGVVEELRRKI